MSSLPNSPWISSVLTEPLPIETWINLHIADNKITAAMENWRVEPERVQQIVVAHFKEMGIFMVEPSLEGLLFEKMLFIILNAPEIQSLLRKAEQAEARKKANRHETD